MCLGIGIDVSAVDDRSLHCYGKIDGAIDGTFDGTFDGAFDTTFNRTFGGTFDETFGGTFGGTIDRTVDRRLDGGRARWRHLQHEELGRAPLAGLRRLLNLEPNQSPSVVRKAAPAQLNDARRPDVPCIWTCV